MDRQHQAMECRQAGAIDPKLGENKGVTMEISYKVMFLGPNGDWTVLCYASDYTLATKIAKHQKESNDQTWDFWKVEQHRPRVLTCWEEYQDLMEDYCGMVER